MWEIKSKNGVVKAYAANIEYTGEWMSETYVELDIVSPTPIDFVVGDYIEYRDERFEINYDPTVIKSATQYAKGDAFKYDKIKFNSLADELTRCDFLDIVLGDNQMHYTGLPKFSFYAATLQEFGDRIQANLNRAYGENTWQVVVNAEYANETDVNISIDNQNIWDALSLVVDEFDAYFTIKDRVITLGTAGVAAAHLFKYGKGNGFRQLERTADTDQAIVTRLRAFGSTRNIPHRYYNSLSDADGVQLVPDNMSVQYLMLPGFPDETLDPYIDSDNISALGVREGCVFFDGSDEDLDEIYPSIEGVTSEDLTNAGFTWNAPTGWAGTVANLDEIISTEEITDNGVGVVSGDEVIPENKKYTFEIEIYDIGFDINDYLSTDTAKVSFKSGKLSGREFDIVKCTAKTNSDGAVNGYTLRLNREYDEDVQLWFPYNSYNAEAGDKFVLLEIEMPEVYIKTASQRLLTAAKKWLSENDYARSTYTPKVDNIFMARQHDEAVASGGTIVSLHDTLKEGMLMLFEDEDLNVANASIFIDKLVIKEGEKYPIPEYEVTLKEEKTVGAIEKIQNTIDSLVSGGQGGGGYTAAQIRSLIDAYGASRFLSKLTADRSVGKISSDVGFEVGSYDAGVRGGYFGKDTTTSKTIAEVDNLYVRMKAYFEQLTIIKSEWIAGKQYISPGGGITIKEVLLNANGNYECYYIYQFANDEEHRSAELKIGDLVRCEDFNINGGSRYYWRKVIDWEADYTNDDAGNMIGMVCLSNVEGEYDPDSDIPQAGDTICQCGNVSDPERQSVIIISTVGNDAPSIKLLNGINTFSLENKEIVCFGLDHTTGDIFCNMGATTDTNYLLYKQSEGLTIAGKILASSTYNGQTFEEAIKDSLNLSSGEQLLLNTDGLDALNIPGTSDIEGNWTYSSATKGYAEIVEPSSSDATYHYGRRSFHIYSDQTGGTYYFSQMVKNIKPATEYTLSGYIYIPDSASIYNAIASVVQYTNIGTTVTTVSTGKLFSISDIDKGSWVYFAHTFKTKANADYTDRDEEDVDTNFDASYIDIRFTVSRYGEYYLNSLKLEEGSKATPWCVSSKDTGLVRTALSEGGTIEAGLMLSRIIKTGHNDDDGNFQTTAGLNGVVENGDELAVWGGGDCIDKASDPDNENAATAAIRHDGTAYFCNDVIRLTDNSIEVGNNVIFDKEGVKLFDEDNNLRLRVVNVELSEDSLNSAEDTVVLDESESNFSFGITISETTEYALDTTEGITYQAITKGASKEIWSDVLSVGQQLSANITFGFTYQSTATVMSVLSANAKIRLLKGTTELATWTAPLSCVYTSTVDDTTLFQMRASKRITYAIEEDATYSIVVEVEKQALTHVYSTTLSVGNTTYTISGNASSYSSGENILAKNGFMSAWGDTALLCLDGLVKAKQGGLTAKLSDEKLTVTIGSVVFTVSASGVYSNVGFSYGTSTVSEDDGTTNLSEETEEENDASGS